jgi:Cation/multidrug efflux pump
LVSYNGRPSIMLSITKQADANTLELVERLQAFAGERNPLLAGQGVQLALIDDQTHATRHAIGVMESNAIFGLFAVLVMCWIFLGSRLACWSGWACRSRSPAPSSRWI